MPRLTVLLPVHNGGVHLRRAVASTLRALPGDAELLVVDDASTDGTARLLGAVADRRLRVLARTASSGVADALAAGLEASEGELVGRMDADDVCPPWRFTRQLALIGRADLVFGSMALISGTGRPIGASSALPVRPDAARFHLAIGNFFSHPTLLARRSVLVGAGGYLPGVVEDYDLWLRCAARDARMLLDPVPALAYRRHAGQVTSTWQPPRVDPRLDAALAALLPGELLAMVPDLRRSAISRTRTTPSELAAWRALTSWIASASSALPALDRFVLGRRVARWTPRRLTR